MTRPVCKRSHDSRTLQPFRLKNQHDHPSVCLEKEVQSWTVLCQLKPRNSTLITLIQSHLQLRFQKRKSAKRRTRCFQKAWMYEFCCIWIKHKHRHYSAHIHTFFVFSNFWCYTTLCPHSGCWARNISCDSSLARAKFGHQEKTFWAFRCTNRIL